MSDTSPGDGTGLRPLAEGLNEILGRLGLPADLDMTTLVRDWSDLAGEPFGSRSRPAGFRSGELFLDVGDGATATVLRYRIGELIERLDRRFGKGRVTAVRIRVAKKGPG